MNREKQLAKNTIIIGFGTFLPRFMSVITLPIVTGYLSKTEYGTYDLLLTLISLILPIATLQIQSAAFRFLIQCRKDHEECATVISTIFYFTCLMSIIPIVVIFFVIDNYPIGTRVMICAYFLCDIILHTFQQVVRGLGKNLVYSISTILTSIINMILLVILVRWVGWGLEGVILSLVVTNTLSLIYLFVFGGIYGYLDNRAYKKATLKKMIAYSWPMIPNNLSSWVMSLSDRLLIVYFLGVEVNAVYVVAKKIPNLVATVQSTFGLAWQENASLAANDKDVNEYYSKMFDTIFNLVVGASASLIGFAPVLFALLVRGDYAQSYSQMPILFLGMTFSALASYMGGIYIAYKRTKEIGITTVVAAVINLMISVVGIPIVGIWAASISMLISYIFLFFYRVWDIKKYNNLQYNIKKNAICLVLLVILCILSFYNNFLLNVIILLAGVLMAVILNLDIIKVIIGMLLSKKRHKNPESQ